MTPEDLAGIDDYIEKRIALDRKLAMIHLRKERYAAEDVVEAAKAWQRISTLAGRGVTNDEAWQKFARPGMERPKEF